jgi:hypothetical protein
MTESSGYPHQFVGEEAGPPEPAGARILSMARRAEARLMGGGHDALAGAPAAAGAAQWRLAGAIAVLGDEANAANPNRDKSSDGTIGDARHVAEGSDSDHNPWVVVNGVGVVRARDIDVDGLDLATATERARQWAAAGRLPQLTGGGYIILNRRITNEDFSGWHAYTGPDPHITHAHFSVSLNAAQFDSRAPWGIFAGTPPTPPAPAPAPPAPGPGGRPAYNWTGPDLTGAGPGLRGAAGPPDAPTQTNGPRMGRLHDFLRINYPAYAGDLPDASSAEYGWYGAKTAAALAEFAHRSNIPEADGNNIGPRLALALFQAGARP